MRDFEQAYREATDDNAHDADYRTPESHYRETVVLDQGETIAAAILVGMIGFAAIVGLCLWLYTSGVFQ